MSNVMHKLTSRLLRKNRVRATVSGTPERPRLTVYVSNMHIHAQIIDDTTGKTLVSTSTAAAKDAQKGNLTAKAIWAGTDIAAKAKKAHITKVVFDRNGRKYHGRLQALCDAARAGGLEF